MSGCLDPTAMLDIAPSIQLNCALTENSWRTMLGILLSLDILCILYAVHILRGAVRLARKLAMVSLVSQCLLLAYLIARHVEVIHDWASSVLWILSFYSLYILGGACLFYVLVVPIRFLSSSYSPYFVGLGFLFVIIMLVLPVPLLLSSSVLRNELDVHGFNVLFHVFYILLALASIVFFCLLQIAITKVNNQIKTINTRYAPDQYQRRFREFSQRMRIFNFVVSLALGTITLLSIVMLSLGFAKPMAVEYNFVMWFFIVLSQIAFGAAYCFLSDAQARSGGIRQRISKKLSKLASSSKHDSKTDPFLQNGMDLELLAAPKTSVYTRIGGDKAIEAAVKIFYGKVLADPTLRDFFGQTKMKILEKKQKMFLILVTGGPAFYSGKSLREAHKHLKLEESHFASVGKHLLDTLNELNISHDMVQEIMENVVAVKNDILNIGPIDPEDSFQVKVDPHPNKPTSTSVAAYVQQ